MGRAWPVDDAHLDPRTKLTWWLGPAILPIRAVVIDRGSCGTEVVPSVIA